MKQVFSKNYWSDKDISLLVGQILRTGVILASSVLVIGGIWYLIVHGQDTVPNYKDFVGEGKSNTTISGIIVGAFNKNIPQIIQLGFYFDLYTDCTGGRLSFGFVIEKDKLYIVITLIVLAVIIGSILSGVKG
ncbi:DUF1634 domain-containing protein [Sphingobacterium sp. E70]|uniref:DUF1634 domain-containing protein n=1 Tax=Sphingobacterium sp. E70 TaxID=2853439 RepID=UPI00211C3882|nr:DUF1634 domain-containing protein [Sphingobacterium sp. E70]ULT22757.1 DUF1634 domain-containing protein [Sphingobacterium sp. E70]